MYNLWPYGVQGIFIFSYSAIRCKWSVYVLWPYGVQGRLLLISLVPPYGGYGGCDGVSHSVQGTVITNCLILPYSVNGRFMLSFLR